MGSPVQRAAGAGLRKQSQRECADVCYSDRSGSPFTPSERASRGVSHLRFYRTFLLAAFIPLSLQEGL